jgi:signal transduction histidine kinase
MSIDTLRHVPLFSGLTAEDLQTLSRIAEQVRLASGEELFSEGSEGDRASVLLEDALEVFKSSGGRQVLLSVRQHPGELVGEMALLEQAPRMASVRARAPTTLLAIPRQQFDELISASPSAARTLFRTVISRWRDTQGMLQQSEKMAQLGTLTAGVAHELNNPASAVKRSATELRAALGLYEKQYAALLQSEAGRGKELALEGVRKRIANALEHQPILGSLERSDRESEVEVWLQKNGLGDSAGLSADLVSLGYDSDALLKLASDFPGVALGIVLDWACGLFTVHSLLKQVAEGAGRISEIVKALKSYSFLDQAPLQTVDVREGLEDTLLILGHKLKGKIEIKREYASDTPRIEGHGSELNQVWTNILDNAADALGGTGRIVIRTRRDADSLVVEIEDNGPGIPLGTQERVFDAFFTTKPPGQGTGLGLHISYNIVVQRHRGEIRLSSAPGKTCFQVRLPSGRAGPQPPMSR